MKLKHLVSISALAALVACAGPLSNVAVDVHLPAIDTYDLWVDTTPATKPAMLEAVSQWQTYTDVVIHVHDGPHTCVEAGCFHLTETSLQGLDTVTDTTWDGWTIPGTIFIAPGLKYDLAQHTATHEIGHALGLAHHPLPYYAAMAPNNGEAADHVACDDVRQYYSVRSGVIPKTVTPCTDARGPLPYDAGAE